MYFYYCIWLVSDYYSVPQWNGLDCCNWIVVNRKIITYLHSAFNWAFCLHLNKFSLVSNIWNRFKCKVMLVLVDFTNKHLSFIELSSNLNKQKNGEPLYSQFPSGRMEAPASTLQKINVFSATLQNISVFSVTIKAREIFLRHKSCTILFLNISIF